MFSSETIQRNKLSLLIFILLFIFLFVASESLIAKENIRARDIGIPFEGTPGALNAITDIPGVEVGQKTIITGEGSLQMGEGPVRTGITGVFPLGKANSKGVAASYFSQNGIGELTGTHVLNEYGLLLGPVLITNTLSVGVVRDAAIEWARDNIDNPYDLFGRSIPVVGETWDGSLNDIYGFHIKKEHVFEVFEKAKSGPVEEGNVGGGTGMSLYEFKGGIGTASRVLSKEMGGYTVGVLVQGNCGRRPQLNIAGVPVGKEITDFMPNKQKTKTKSIIIVVGTDAPLLPIQLKRMAKRAVMGLARTGSISMDGSGDIILAFSNANALRIGDMEASWKFLPPWLLDPIFEAVVQATE
ncbi:P1 family peptidase, partial [bacterium]|nr:P1 family peptidase [bacterium]